MFCPVRTSRSRLRRMQAIIEQARQCGRNSSLDDPPAAAWFARALDLGWTRDPFDRLIVAHARLRGWRLATADTGLLERLSEAEPLEF